MSTQLKLRRGTTAQHSSFTGASGEITVDTSKNTVVVHDGSTAGGYPLAKEAALGSYLTTSSAASTYQPLDADLTAIAALSGTSGFLKTNGSGTWSVDTSAYLTTGSAASTYAPLASPSFSGNVTLSAGTANGVPYLNASKVLTTGSALTFDGSLLKLGTGAALSVQGVAFPASGSGAEIFWDGSESIVQSYNRTSSAYVPLWLESSYTRFGINGSEQMRLTSTGLGIGTSSPGYKLDVTGGARVTGAVYLGSASNQDSRIYIGGSPSTSNSAAMDFVTSNTQTNWSIRSNWFTAGAFQISPSTTAGGSTFTTAAFTLDSSGNLGLGVTPSAWGAGSKALQVGTAFGLRSTTSAGYEMYGNAYNNGTNDIYISTNYATKYQTYNGQHLFFTAPSGTAGAAITFTQAMTLAANSELNIDSGTSGGRLTFTPGNASNSISSTTTGFGAYNILRYYGTQHQWFNPSTQAMTLDASGNLGVGATTSVSGYRIRVQNVNDATGYTATNASGGYASLGLTSAATSEGFVDATNVFQFRVGGTERARINSIGDIGVGTSSPTNFQQFGYGPTVEAAGGHGGSFIVTNGAGTLKTVLSNTASQDAGILKTLSAVGLAFGTNDTERARIDSSGNLLVGFTAGGLNNSGSFQFSPGTSAYGGVFNVNHSTSNVNGSGYINFGYNGSAIGSISQNGTTGVLYNLTSDYRLKNNPTALTGAKEFVMALQPKTWDWWDGSGKGVGFIAHEFMEVAKYSGNGEKDAVDADGNPVYQSIQPSSSEVMANLVALLQEQQAIIEQLKSRIEVLESK